MKVKDEYRTNSLSLKPGGQEVTVLYENGKSYTYDKIKNPSLYIRNISDKKPAKISKVFLNGDEVWNPTVSESPWIFKS